MCIECTAEGSFFVMADREEKRSLLDEVAQFLERNREDIATKVIKYYRKYIPAYSGLSNPEFLEEVRDEVLESMVLMRKHIAGEAEVGYVSSEFFRKLVERRLVQGIPFSEFLAAFIMGKNVILNSLKKEFLPQNLDPREVFQFFQALSDATERVLIPMALTYEDTQEFIDSLTRTYSHSFFQEALAEALSKAGEEEEALSVILINIDHFRQLNELFGYRQSDTVLRQLAQVIVEHVHTADDSVARPGGDLFAVILPHRNKGQALKSAKKLKKSIDEHEFYIQGYGTRHVTVTMGIVSYPEDLGRASEFLEKGLKALGEGKKKGRNTIVAYREKEQA
jgi:diguanylate cyclase (GGDEF)-like protein